MITQQQVKVALLAVLLGIFLFVCLPVAADVPDLSHSYAVIAYSEPVSVYSLPNGQGHPLTTAYAFGGEVVDATITVVLLDVFDNPIAQYPYEDIWLEGAGGTFVFCPGGTTADQNTDENGETTITGPLQAGCWADPLTEGMIVLINGDALPQPPFALGSNSPDLNCDLIMNIVDVVTFVNDYFGSYIYRSDFYWDGTLNLSDIVLLSRGLGAACP